MTRSKINRKLPPNPKAGIKPAAPEPDRVSVKARCAELLADRRVVYLDVETTGVKADAEIVQIAALRYDGAVLLDRLVKPPTKAVSAFNLAHGILAEQVAVAPEFAALYAELWDILRARVVVGYNVDFDRRVIERACAESSLPQFEVVEWVDVMPLYGEWIGKYDGRWKRWSRHKLPGGEHQALSDCQATRLLVQDLASRNAA